MHHEFLIMHWKVVPGRLELPTSTLSVWRSNQLSYRTVLSAGFGLRRSSLFCRVSFVSYLENRFVSTRSEGNFQLANFLLLFFRIVVVIKAVPIIDYAL